ncbi:MAG: hypothetical protein AABX05_01240 [Nanoarchaeota archaeon]
MAGWDAKFHHAFFGERGHPISPIPPEPASSTPSELENLLEAYKLPIVAPRIDSEKTYLPAREEESKDQPVYFRNICE